MASKITVRLLKEEIKILKEEIKILKEDGSETPLLDLSDAAVKGLIRNARKRGSVSHDRINALLSSGR